MSEEYEDVGIGSRRSPRKGAPRRLQPKEMPSREEEEASVQRHILEPPEVGERLAAWKRFRNQQATLGVREPVEPPPHWEP